MYAEDYAYPYPVSLHFTGLLSGEKQLTKNKQMLLRNPDKNHLEQEQLVDGNFQCVVCILLIRFVLNKYIY